MAPATAVASNNEERLPYILYRSRIKKSTGPASVVEGPVPFIDLEGLNDQQRRSSTINQIGEACANYGFFRVKNHGVPETIRTKMLQTTKDFFNLPEEEKLQYAATNGQRKKFELVVGNHYNGSTKQADNSWREVVKFPIKDNMEDSPKNPPSFKVDVAEYSASMRVLVKILLEVISESLGLDKDYIEKTIKNHHPLSAAFNHYPVCPNPEEHLGAIPHSDPSVITVVQLDDVPGLQFDHDGNWLPANPVPDTLLINVGDILQVITNDRYKSPCHRVTATSEKRVSLAWFCFPSSDAIIGPAEKLVDSDHPPLHTYFTFDQFLDNIIKRGEPANCA